jgi:hypothetical protein
MTGMGRSDEVDSRVETPRGGPRPSSGVDDLTILLWRTYRTGAIIELGVKGVVMHASVGDRLVIVGHRVGDPPRGAEILEVRGADGAPPYFVRWEDTGHEGLIFPGSDASTQHVEHHPQ